MVLKINNAPHEEREERKRRGRDVRRMDSWNTSLDPSDVSSSSSRARVEERKRYEERRPQTEPRTNLSLGEDTTAYLFIFHIYKLWLGKS